MFKVKQRNKGTEVMCLFFIDQVKCLLHVIKNHSIYMYAIFFLNLHFRTMYIEKFQHIVLEELKAIEKDVSSLKKTEDECMVFPC